MTKQYNTASEKDLIKKSTTSKHSNRYNLVAKKQDMMQKIKKVVDGKKIEFAVDYFYVKDLNKLYKSGEIQYYEFVTEWYKEKHKKKDLVCGKEEYDRCSDRTNISRMHDMNLYGTNKTNIHERNIHETNIHKHNNTCNTHKHNINAYNIYPKKNFSILNHPYISDVTVIPITLSFDNDYTLKDSVNLFYSILHSENLLECFEIGKTQFLNFINTVFYFYNENTYHNIFHGFNILFTGYFLYKKRFTKDFDKNKHDKKKMSELLGLLLALFMHDIGHLGFSSITVSKIFGNKKNDVSCNEIGLNERNDIRCNDIGLNEENIKDCNDIGYNEIDIKNDNDTGLNDKAYKHYNSYELTNTKLFDFSNPISLNEKMHFCIAEKILLDDHTSFIKDREIIDMIKDLILSTDLNEHKRYEEMIIESKLELKDSTLIDFIAIMKISDLNSTATNIEKSKKIGRYVLMESEIEAEFYKEYCKHEKEIQNGAKLDDSIANNCDDNHGAKLDDNIANNCDDNYGAKLDDSIANNCDDNYGAKLDDSIANNCDDNHGAKLDDNIANNCDDNYGAKLDDSIANNCDDVNLNNFIQNHIEETRKCNLNDKSDSSQSNLSYNADTLIFIDKYFNEKYCIIENQLQFFEVISLPFFEQVSLYYKEYAFVYENCKKIYNELRMEKKKT